MLDKNLIYEKYLTSVLEESEDFQEIGDLLKRHETLRMHQRDLQVGLALAPTLRPFVRPLRRLACFSCPCLHPPGSDALVMHHITPPSDQVLGAYVCAGASRNRRAAERPVPQ